MRFAAPIVSIFFDKSPHLWEALRPKRTELKAPAIELFIKGYNPNLFIDSIERALIELHVLK